MPERTRPCQGTLVVVERGTKRGPEREGVISFVLIDLKK